MIVLIRQKPHKLEACEVLLRRGIFTGNDYESLKDVYMKTLIGFEGECYADKYWQDLRLNIPHALLHSYETTHLEFYHHQMDTIFICKHFILIVELKYVSGEISYNEDLSQFWRKQSGQLLTLRDPFAQLSRHEAFMTLFLLKIGVDIPIITAVVVTAKSAFLYEMPKHRNIFKLDGLGMKLKSWLEEYPEVISDEEVFRISSKLIDSYDPRRWVWRNQFPNLQVKKGVLCLCGETMKFHRGKYYCSCGRKDRNSLYEAINDYRVVISEWISNYDFRNFLEIESVNTVNKMLKRVSDAYHGENRGRIYRLSKEKIESLM